MPRPREYPGRNMGICKLIQKEIRAGKDNQSVLEVIRAEIPQCKTTLRTIHNQRFLLRVDDDTILKSRDIGDAQGKKRAPNRFMKDYSF